MFTTVFGGHYRFFTRQSQDLQWWGENGNFSRGFEGPPGFLALRILSPGGPASRKPLPRGEAADTQWWPVSEKVSHCLSSCCRGMLGPLLSRSPFGVGLNSVPDWRYSHTSCVAQEGFVDRRFTVSRGVIIGYSMGGAEYFSGMVFPALFRGGSRIGSEGQENGR